MQKPITTVLFDLDGTLADTAADLAAPVNLMRAARGLAAMPLEQLRPYASAGARGLIGAGLGVPKDAKEFPSLRDEFLQLYERNMVVHTRLFPQIEELLVGLEQRGIVWGVVSNKVERYVRPILLALGLAERSRVAIGGDTTAYAKPHPEPLLHACRLLAVSPAHTVYVGDDARDIVAGKAAGMRTVAAAYGYCGADDPPSAWGADLVIDSPSGVMQML
jgi:N-acetyl-D-muramate 6-phosphate phosphatase